MHPQGPPWSGSLIASDIITEIVDRIRPIRADLTESTGDDRLDLSSPELAIELLGAIGTFQRLLHLPECPRRWVFEGALMVRST